MLKKMVIIIEYSFFLKKSQVITIIKIKPLNSLCFKTTNVGKGKLIKVLKEWTISKITYIKKILVFKDFKVVNIECAQYNYVMNERNWFAVLKTYEKIKINCW